MTRIRPLSSCRPVVNVLESLSLRIGYAKRMLVAVTGVQCAENVGTKFTQEMQKLQKSLLTVWSEAEKVYTTGQNIEK